MLFNRRDCCGERLNNFMITVGSNSSGVNNTVCVADGGDVSNRKEIVSNCLPRLEGQYVHVKLKGQNRTLTLCEIEVYKKPDAEKLECK